MKRRWLAMVSVSAALWSSTAMADGAGPDRAKCLDASSQAQTFRDAHKLMAARDQLRICAQQSCPGVVQKDCLTWLDAVEQSLPTVIITAHDHAGASLVDVKVTVDGQLLSKFQGEAVPLDPGPHALHFEATDGSALDQQVVVEESVKNQKIAVVLGKEAAAAPAAAAPAAAATPPPGESPGAFPWRTVGWVTGGAGVVGLGVGAIFGFVAISDKNGGHCANNLCDPGTSSGVKSAALLSDVGWVAGGLLLATGAALVLFAPSESAGPAAGVRVAPVVVAGGGGLVAGARW